MLARIAAAGGTGGSTGTRPGSAAARSTRTSPPASSPTTSARGSTEAVEKRRKGMWVFIRQGSASQNLRDADRRRARARHRPAPRSAPTTASPTRCCARGHINDCARLAVAAGVSEIDALLLASTNPAALPRLHPPRLARPGLPGRRARFDELGTLAAGARVAGRPARRRATARSLDGRGARPRRSPSCMRGDGQRRRAAGRRRARARPPGRHAACAPSASRAAALTTTLRREPSLDAARRRARRASSSATTRTGRIGRGYATGFGLQRGAIASTVAHDAPQLRGRRRARRGRGHGGRGRPAGRDSAAVRWPCSTGGSSPRSRCRSPG